MWPPRNSAPVRRWLAVVSLLVVAPWLPAQEEGADSAIERPMGSRRSDLSDEETPPPAPQGVEMSSPTTAGPVGNPEIRLYVRAFRFIGNTIIDTAQLAAVARPYEEREITDVDLQELRRTLTALYTRAGYITSFIVIPDQEIVDGVVTLQAVEGRLGAVHLVGVENYDQDFLKRWIAAGIESPIRARQLEEHLLTVLQDPSIADLDPQLIIGEDRSTSVLQVEVREAPRFGARVSFADDRTPAVGGTRGELELLARNLLGRGDVSSVSLEGSRGLQIVDGRTDVPLNVHGTRLQLRYANYDTRIIEEPLEDLDIESESRIFELGLQQALVRQLRRTVTAGFSVDGRDSDSFLDGVPFSFSPGAVNGETRIRAARLRLAWLERAQRDVFSAQAVLSVGLDAFNATVHDDDRPDSEFKAILVAGQWLHSFGGSWGHFYSRFQLQKSGDSLLPLEKVAVGGTRSVRGYRRARLVRDSGWDASIEYRLPVTRIPVPGLSGEGQGKVSAVAFADAGRAWNEDNGEDTGNRTLVGAGPGFRWDVNDGLRAEFYWAAYQRDLDFEKSDIQDHGIHFQVGYHTDF